MYHVEYPQCKAIPDPLNQPVAIPADHSDYPCQSSQKGCHALVLYVSAPIPTGLWSGILCLQERHISLYVCCLNPIFLEDTDAYQAAFDSYWQYIPGRHPSDSWLFCPNVHNIDDLLLQNRFLVWASQIRLYVWSHALHLLCVQTQFRIHHQVLAHLPMGSLRQSAEGIDYYYQELSSGIAPYYPSVDTEADLAYIVWLYQPLFVSLWRSNEQISGETAQNVLLLVVCQKIPA